MGYTSRDNELRIRIADLLMTAIKDASIEALRLGINSEEMADIMVEMIDQLHQSVKYGRDLLNGARGNDSTGFDSGSSSFTPPSRRLPYNRH